MTEIAEFGRHAEDYVRHRAGFPDSFFLALQARGLVRPGLRVVDLGTGTGTIARTLAGLGCTVTGIDPDEAMLEGARRMAREQGVDVAFSIGRAEASGVSDHSTDLVTAGQCWHWFDEAAAAKEIRRILVPGGTIAIAHFDWIPLAGNICEATEQLIEAHSPTWVWSGGVGVHPRSLPHLGNEGFTDLQTFSYDEPVRYTHDRWCGRIRACAGIVGLEPEAVAQFDSEHRAVLADHFPDPMDVPHRVFVVTGRSPETAE